MREFARLGLDEAGQGQRDVAGKIAVLLGARAFDFDARIGVRCQRAVGPQAIERLGDEFGEVLFQAASLREAGALPTATHCTRPQRRHKAARTHKKASVVVEWVIIEAYPRLSPGNIAEDAEAQRTQRNSRVNP